MSTNPRHDARHALNCAVREQVETQQRIRLLRQQLADAEHDLSRALTMEKSAREKLLKLS